MILRISPMWTAVITAAALLRTAGSLPASEPAGAPPATLPAQAAAATPAKAAEKAPLAPAALGVVPPAPEILQVGRRAETGLTRRQEKQLSSSGTIVGTSTGTTAPIVQGAPAVDSASTGEVVFDSSSPQPYTDDGTHGKQLHPCPSDAEGTVRITDRPYTTTSYGYGYSSPYDHGLSKYDLKKICPECRIAPDGLPYHLSCYDPTDRQLRRYRLRHGLKFSPDYGFCLPSKLPIDYYSMDYLRQFPNSWYGYPQAQGVVRPQVYWPTDTTQLGYTYQHVPRWLPAYGMVPPVPHPDHWNVYHCSQCGHYGHDCRTGLCGRCQQGNCRTGNCRQAHCPTGQCRTGHYPSVVPQQGPCPSCQPGAIIQDATPSEAGPEPTPNEAAPAPLPPQSASNGPSLNSPTNEPVLVPVPR